MTTAQTLVQTERRKDDKVCNHLETVVQRLTLHDEVINAQSESIGRMTDSVKEIARYLKSLNDKVEHLSVTLGSQITTLHTEHTELKKLVEDLGEDTKKAMQLVEEKENMKRAFSYISAIFAGMSKVIGLLGMILGGLWVLAKALSK